MFRKKCAKAKISSKQTRGVYEIEDLSGPARLSYLNGIGTVPHSIANRIAFGLTNQRSDAAKPGSSDRTASSR